MRVEIPYKWKPRPYQVPFFEAMEAGRKRACLVWHRRAGKDLTALNWLVVSSFMRKGLYWHAFPTYKQGRKIAWEGMTKAGRGFMDHIPEELIARKRDDEMTIWLRNGSIYQVIGADDYNKLVGANPIGVIVSEYPIQDPGFWNFTRPILAENDGWAVFPFTPRGRNHGYKMFQVAKTSERWFCQLLTVDDTFDHQGSRVVIPEVIEADREEGMPEELVQQEYFCSWDAPLVGSFYGDILSQAREEGRVGRVPWEPKIPVYTGWDLGMADRTCIWYAQRVGRETRLINFQYGQDKSLEHYAKLVREQEYLYERHYGPHDAQVRELGTGATRVETLRDLGIRMKVVPKLSLADGISATRLLLRSAYIDEARCEYGLQALLEYQKEQTGQFDPNGQAMYRDIPLHNWASDPADALRYLAIGFRGGRREDRRGEDRPLAPKLAIV